MSKSNIIPFIKGELSQWYPCTFIIDDIKYNCCEQYMMSCKAKMFNDGESLIKIMKTLKCKNIME